MLFISAVRRYGYANIDYIDLIDYDQFSINELDRILEELGYTGGRILFTHFKIHGHTLGDGLVPLRADEDVLTFMNYVPRFREIKVYIESRVSLVEKDMMEVRNQGKGAAIEEIVEDNVVKEAGKEGKFRNLLEEIDFELEHGSENVKEKLSQEEIKEDLNAEVQDNVMEEGINS
ncbi:hypothetical protein Tco_1168125 [Tanacetum coccineum]